MKKDSVELIFYESKDKLKQQIEVQNVHNAKAGMLLAILIFLFGAINQSELPPCLETVISFSSLLTLIFLLSSFSLKEHNLPPNITKLQKKYAESSKIDTMKQLTENYIEAVQGFKDNAQKKANCLKFAFELTSFNIIVVVATQLIVNLLKLLS